MINSILLKLAMLVLFLLAVTFTWSAITMVFDASLFNILLGIMGIFFLLRALEIADKINNLGPYAEPAGNEDKDKPAEKEGMEEPTRPDNENQERNFPTDEE